MARHGVLTVMLVAAMLAVAPPRVGGAAVAPGARMIADAGADAELRVALLQLARGKRPRDADPVAPVVAALKEAAAGGAQLALLPAGWLAADDAGGEAAIVAAAAQLQLAVVVTTTNASSDTTASAPTNELSARLYDAQGRAVAAHSKAADAAVPGPTTTGANFTAAVAQLRLPASTSASHTQPPDTESGGGTTTTITVGVGLMLDREFEFFHGARVLMLQGAEVVLVAGTGTAPAALPAQQALYTRAWENVLGLGMANDAAGGGSCAYLGTKDTASGIGQTLLSPAATPAGSAGVHVVAFNLTALRGNRSDAIWGDAFRRPFAYQPLCGLGSLGGGGGGRGVDGGGGGGEGAVGVLPEAVDPAAAAVAAAAPVPLPVPSTPKGNNASLALRIALLQLSPTSSEAGNADKAEAMAERAAAGGADVVVMPELYAVGYCALCPRDWTNVTGLYEWAARAQPDGPGNAFVARFAALARRLGVAIQASYLRASPHGGPPENAVALIDRHGSIAHTYSKVHTAVWSQCEAMTQPGNVVRVASLDTARAGPVRVGSMICADREFPEMPRMVAEAGAEVMLISNACDLTDWHLAMLRTRAFANAAAIGMANYAAPACNGRSPVYGPRGETLAVAGNATEQIVTAEVDISALRAYRATAAGAARLARAPQLRLCEPVKSAAFAAQNPLRRPGHSM